MAQKFSIISPHFRKAIHTKIALFIFFCLLTTVSFSQITWTGAAQDQDWHNPNNWSTSTVPTISDDVVINNTINNYPEISGVATARYLLIYGELTVLASGKLAIDGTGVNSYGIYISTIANTNGNNFNNHGIINIKNVGIMGLRNFGAFHNHSTGKIFILSTGNNGLSHEGANFSFVNDGRSSGSYGK